MRPLSSPVGDDKKTNGPNRNQGPKKGIPPRGERDKHGQEDDRILDEGGAGVEDPSNPAQMMASAAISEQHFQPPGLYCVSSCYSPLVDPGTFKYMCRMNIKGPPFLCFCLF